MGPRLSSWRRVDLGKKKGLYEYFLYKKFDINENFIDLKEKNNNIRILHMLPSVCKFTHRTLI